MPGSGGGGSFDGEGVGQHDAICAGGAVGVVEGSRGGQVLLKAFAGGVGQHGDAALTAFGFLEGEDAAGEVDVFDAEADALDHAQAGAVEELGHEKRRAIEFGEEAAGLLDTEDDGHFAGTAGANEAGEVAGVASQDVFVEEHEGIEGLHLGAGGDIAPDGEVAEESGDFGGAHFLGVTFAVKEDEAAGPEPVGLFGAEGEVAEAAGFAETFFQPPGLLSGLA